MYIPLVIQHRHVHLSKTDLRTLFGDETCLTIESDLDQKGQVLYKETLVIEGKTGVIESVRVLGPARKKTQIELSLTDAFAIGLKVPIRLSGDLLRSASCKLIGPKGTVRASSSVIVPARHMHCSDHYAKKMSIKNQDVVSLRSVEYPEKILTNIFVRVHPSFECTLHLNADEAAHHWLQSGELFEIC